jgi:hypothetical protein
MTIFDFHPRISFAAVSNLFKNSLSQKGSIMNRFLVATSIIGTVIAASAIPAKASIVLTEQATGGGDNVTFKTVTGDGTTTLTSNTNKGENVTFTSTVALTVPSSGQARIEATDPANHPLQDLTWFLTSSLQGTTKDVFDINIDKKDSKRATDVSVYVNGNLVNTEALGNGSNFFTVTASGSDIIKTIGIFMNGDVQDVQQFRIDPVALGGGVGGLPPPVGGAVPEPSTWAMMILGFLGLGLMAYRRKNSVVRLVA